MYNIVFSKLCSSFYTPSPLGGSVPDCANCAYFSSRNCGKRLRAEE